MRRKIAALAFALLGSCCQSAASDGSKPAPDAAPSQPAALPPTPAPKNLSIGKLGADDVRAGVQRAGWSVTAELGTQFDSCKTSQLDVRKGSLEGTAQLHDCADEYDAKRRESAVRSGGDDQVIERQGGHMFEVQVRGDGAEAKKLFAAVLGR
jgi:hypothetical protein